MMDTPDFVAYVNCMEEIKRRLLAVDYVLDGKYTTPYPYTNWEFVALQFRMVFELIVLASLASHKHLFEKMSKRLSEEWKIGAVVRAVREKNPDFYPHPIQRVASQTPGIKDDWKEVNKDYLKLGELIEAHGRLGGGLHARNPYVKDEAIQTLRSNFSTWREKVIALLDNHTVRFPGEERILYVGMQSQENGTVHTAWFSKIGPVAE